MAARLGIIGFLSVLIISFGGCSNEIESPTAVPQPPEQPDTPRDLSADVGDGQITLSWNINHPETVGHYRVYLSDSAFVDGMRFLDTASQQSYDVTGLVNGKRYFFRVAMVNSAGLEGEMSDALMVVPGKFAITIENYSKYTNSRQVRINTIAPNSAELVELSEDPAFAVDVRTAEFASSLNFELSNSDGVKTVYARFELNGGGTSLGTVSDNIILDRVAVIEWVTVSASGQIGPGSVIRFSVHTSEYGGEASVDVDGLGTIDLNDRGLNGDVTADDGIYEVEFTIPINTELHDAEVVGSFTDAAGNSAPPVTAATTLTVHDLPDPVALSGFAVSSSAVSLQWSESTISDFAAYRIFRAENAGVGQSSDLVTTITGRSTISYTDTALQASTTYYYRLYVYDSDANSAGSDSIQVTTLVNQPPEPVVLAARLTGEALTVELSWEQATDSDFKTYHILRDNAPLPAEYNAINLIKLVTNRSTTTYNDKVPSADTYYFQVYVFDRQGAMSGSNIVSMVVP